jgi:predicted transcriptional regulator YdeE
MIKDKPRLARLTAIITLLQSRQLKENWILIAFCRKKSDFRAFRLDRIEKILVTSEHFQPHDLTLEEYLQQCRKNWMSTPDIPLSPAPDTFALDQKNKEMQQVIIEPFQLIGIAVRTTNKNEQAAGEIAELWGRFLSEKLVGKIPNKVDDTIYSLYTDYQGDHTRPYTAILGCKVTSLDEIPEGMTGRSFSGGTYLKLSAKGDLRDGIIVKKWTDIWGMDLDRAYTADFEVFGLRAQNPQDAEVDFLIAVK